MCTYQPNSYHIGICHQMPKDLYVDNHSCHPLKSWPSWPQECTTGNALAPRTIHHGCLGGLFSAQKQFLAFFLEDSSLLTSIPKNWAKIEAVSAMIRSMWKKSSTLHQNPIYTELGLKNGFEKTLLGLIVPCSFVAFKQVLRWHAAWNPVDFEPTGCCFYPTSCKQGTTLSTVWAMLQPAATKI